MHLYVYDKKQATEAQYLYSTSTTTQPSWLCKALARLCFRELSSYYQSSYYEFHGLAL